MSASNFLQTQLINAVLDGGTYTGPTTVYAALYSVTPTASSAGTELDGSGYSRQSVSFDITAGVGTNDAAVEFGPATADWTTATGWAVLDDSTGGNVLFYGSFSTAQTVVEDFSLEFAPGTISISFD